MKTVNGIFGFVVVLILFFSVALATQGFITDQHYGINKNYLILHIDKEEWHIGYRFAETCPEYFRKKEEMLKGFIKDALRVWLQPLRDTFPTVPITDKFVLVHQKDFIGRLPDYFALEGLDARINFNCEDGISTALPSDVMAPQVLIRQSVASELRAVLIHEIGHAFGMADTYDTPLAPSAGGLPNTRGMQPHAVMAVPIASPEPHIKEDDKRGIIWLYKHIYEGQPVEDCFFPEYILEEKPIAGCRPKHPLIFAIKYSGYDVVNRILKNDPNIDVNEQDNKGLTALHHAVLDEKRWIVWLLVQQENINPLLLDKQGRSPLGLWEKVFGDKAETEWEQRFGIDWVTAVARILEQDPTLDVNAQDRNGQTLLHHAVMLNHPELVKRVLAHPTFDVRLLSHPTLDVNAQDSNSQTLLHHAVMLNHPELVKGLLAHPTLDVNAQDASGTTSLHHAVALNSPELVKGLLAHKDIKPYISNKAGETPLALAQKLGLTSIVKLLTDHPRAFMAVEPRGKTIAVTWGELKRGN